MRERITGVTIAQNGTVTFEGIRPPYSGRGDPVRFNVTTYETRQRFDWSTLPKCVPVIDLEGSDICLIWKTLLNRDHPSFDCKVASCRQAGLRTTTVGAIARREGRHAAD